MAKGPRILNGEAAYVYPDFMFGYYLHTAEGHIRAVGARNRQVH